MEESESSLANEEKFYYCEPCNLTFKSKKSLAVHRTKSSAHSMNNLECKGCLKKFPCYSRLELHEKSCFELIKQTYNKLNDLVAQKERIELQLHEVRDELSKTKSDLDKTQAKLEAYEEMSLSTKSVNNYYIQNNVINYQSVVERLPMVRDADIVKLIHNAPYESFDSSESLGYYISTQYLSDRMVSTDPSRGVVAWKDENRTIIKDKGAIAISKKITKIGSSNKYEINKKLKDFDEKMDQTNTAHIININNKKETYDLISCESQNFSKNLGKTIAKFTPNLSTFKELPKVKIESFKSMVMQFFQNYGDPCVRHGCKSFLEFFTVKFNKSEPTNKSSFLKLYDDLMSNKIRFFLLNTHTYFLDDIDNLYRDKDSMFLTYLILTFLKDNILRNAARNNKACYFKFSDDDIKLLCNKNNFNSFLIETIRPFF